MTSLGTTFLLVFVWLMTIRQTSGAILIATDPVAGKNGIISVEEMNAIGDKIINITVSGGPKGGLLTVSLKDATCTDLIKLEPEKSVRCTTTCEFSVVAKEVLHRDFGKCSVIKLLITYGFQGTTTSTKLYLISVVDINNNAPEFKNQPYKTSIKEDFAVNTTLPNLMISATDPDNGVNGSFYYTLKNTANINDIMTIDPNSGVIKVMKKLDYEKRNFYQYSVIATDYGTPPRSSSASVWIEILDVQDSPPVFISASFLTHIKEQSKAGDLVMDVSAADGDRGKPNKIVYTIKDRSCLRFYINNTTGAIYVKQTLDLTDASLKYSYGVCPITVIATEVSKDASSTEQNVTIVIDDINDKGPLFNYKQYNANVKEASAKDTPVTVDKSIEITDIDQKVENNKFTITLQYMNGSAFTALRVSPNETVSRAVAALLVQDKTQLDYETKQSVQFKIVAQGEQGKHSSSATVNLQILPDNEFPPVFNSNYNICIPEDMSAGHHVIQVTATDKDKGSDGNIKYRWYGSNGLFEIDEKSGNVTLGTTKLDYEQINFYHLTVEATDGGNKKAKANLFICINDINDERPEFNPSKYESTVKENEKITIYVTAEDKDQPNTNNSEVRYEIVNVTQHLENNFTIDITTGQINAKSIDYEVLKSDQIVIVVMASDQGTPQLHSMATVTITIQDTNDNRPHFSDKVYNFSVPENARTGLDIGNVSAADADRGEMNGKLTYLLVNETDKFRINYQNGTILILGKLDRETCDQYILQVEVVDGGTPQQIDTAILNITVTDINDKSPELVHSNVTEIKENIANGSVVVTISAIDEDMNPSLVYSIYKEQIQKDGKGMFVNIPSSKEYFRINKTSGEIYVYQSLDREVAEIISLGIRVNDTNAVGRPQYSEGQQKIIILDVNDNPPEFLRSFIELSIFENHPVNTTITTVSATDADKDDHVTYSFEETYTQFQINTTTGEITLVKNLDRETNQTISLLVLAEDSENSKVGRLTSTATIKLNILDYNDNSPIFEDGLYNKTYNVSEDVSIGHEIVTVNATDLDIGNNADIRYSFNRRGDEKLPFSIHPKSGRVYVSDKLDREKTASYSIEIQAKDMDGQQSVDAHTGSTWIRISVTDVNDNAPVFTASGLYHASVQEDRKIDQSIMKVWATDKDSAVNGEVSFKLEGNASTLFKIDPSSGIISVLSSLVDQVGEKRFLVVATDNGTPSQNNSANISINITDTNNHAPKFSMKDVIYISEAICPGTVILNVTARDEDFSPPNNEITYELEKKKDYKFFVLDPNSGALSIKKKLDREKQEVYELVIIAKDKGSPSLRNETSLKINATDVDDEPPVFLKKDNPGLKKTFPVAEGKPNRFVGDVTAYDSDPSSTVCYKIRGREEYFEVRSVDSTGTGKIYTRKELDYENKMDFQFDVITYDCNIRVYNNTCNTTVTSSIDDTLEITINITDANDNPPRFKMKSMHTAIQSDKKLHTTIVNLTLKITDADEYPENKKNFFHVSNFKKDGELNMEQEPFSIRGETIITNQLFTAAKMGNIQFTILVNDSIGQNDTAEMKVYIVGEANQVKIKFRLSFEDMQKKKTDYCRQLGEILGNNITIVDGKTESVQENGKFEKKMTFLYIYGIDAKGAVMKAKVLEDLLYKHTHETIDLNNAFSVETLVSRPMAVASSAKMQVILYALIAVLVVSLIAIMLLFYGSNQRFKRKLKAAQIDVHNNKQDFEKWIVPGSNVHALGESNPIYNKEISPVTAAPDKLSLNSLDMNEVGDSAVFVDPFDEQEIALDFIEDHPNETSIGSKDYSKTFLDNVIKEREAEMNKKNMNSESMNGNVNMAFNANNLETTDV